MPQIRIDLAESEKFWLDVVNPTREELNDLAIKYHLPLAAVHDSLDPEHLPKYERISEVTFIIVRAFDEDAAGECDSVQELTRKVAIFMTDTCILTMHRKDQAFFVALREKWRQASDGNSLHHILHDLLNSAIETYAKPIDSAIDKLDIVEERLFRRQPDPAFFEESYYIKRQVSVIRRMIRMTRDAVEKLQFGKEHIQSLYQDVKETADDIVFYADDLLENLNNLINLHVSLSSQHTNEASHRTNEIMRVLTLFSVFFLPLNFLASIYGMNFEHMPELKSEFGYPTVLISMLVLAVGIFTWFYRKGWIHRTRR